MGAGGQSQTEARTRQLQIERRPLREDTRGRLDGEALKSVLVHAVSRRDPRGFGLSNPGP